MIIERGEQGDSQTAVRHGVEKAMAGGRQKEIYPQGKSAKAGRDSPKPHEHQSACQESREKK